MRTENEATLAINIDPECVSRSGRQAARRGVGPLPEIAFAIWNRQTRGLLEQLWRPADAAVPPPPPAEVDSNLIINKSPSENKLLQMDSLAGINSMENDLRPNERRGRNVEQLILTVFRWALGKPAENFVFDSIPISSFGLRASNFSQRQLHLKMLNGKQASLDSTEAIRHPERKQSG